MIVQTPPLQLPEDSLMLSWSLYDRHRFIGLLMKTAREKAGLEQAEASAAAGLSQSTASNIERLAHFRGDDRRRPSRDVILRLARGAYGLDESFVKAIVWAYDKRALTAAERRVYFSQMDACDYEEPQHVQAAYVVGAIEDYILPHLRKRLPEIELDAPLSFERDVAPVRLANVADAPFNGLPDVAVDPPVGVMLQGGVQVFTEAREEWLRGDLELLNQERRPGLSVLVGNLSNRNSPFLSYEEWHRAYRHDAGCLDDGHHPECVPLYAVFVRRLVTYRWRVLADAEMRMPAELKIEPGAEVHLYSKQHLIDFVQTEDDDLREMRKRRIRTLISLLKRSRSRGFEGLRVGLADNLPSLACQVKPFGGCVISRLHEPLPGRAAGSLESEPQDWAPRLVQLQSIDASLPLTMRFRELFDEYVRPEDRQRDNVIAFLYEDVLGSPAILN